MRFFLSERNAIADLSNGPLFHTLVLPASVEEHLLILTVHSLCGDMRTLYNLIQEIANGCDLGNDRDNSNSPISYVQFAEWQRSIIQSDENRIGEQFWRETKLSLASRRLPYEIGHQGKAFTPATLTLDLDSELLTSIGQVVQNAGTKISDFMFVSWVLLHFRLTQWSEFLVGYGIEGRGDPALEGALGPFVKSIPLQFQLDSCITFIEALRQVQSKVRKVENQHQYVVWNSSYDKEVDSIPSVSYEFTCYTPTVSVEHSSFHIVKQQCFFEPFILKLACFAREKTNEIHLEFQYDMNRVNRQSVEILAAQYVSFLKHAARGPYEPFDEFQMEDNSEQRRLFAKRNNIELPSRDPVCIHELIQEQAKRTPFERALVFEEQSLTYAELDRQSDRIARRLISMGVRPETVVGLYIEPSLEMIVGLLGILKSGGAYLGLDPTQPARRLALMIEDSKSHIILSVKQLIGAIPEGEYKIICLDEDWNDLDCDDKRETSNRPTPYNLAYVVFTSGSTGRPKGVAVEHKQIVNYTRSISNIFQFTPEASYALVSSIGADLGNTVIFSSLSTGGCLHIMSKDRLGDAQGMADYFNHHPIDFLKIVPSHLRMILNACLDNPPLPLTGLILGGEGSLCDWVDEVRGRNPSCIVYNHYGPTETTVGVMTQCVPDPPTVQSSHMLQLDRLIDNVSIYLLNRNMRPASVWQPAELYVGGEALAPGLHQPG